MAQFEIREPSIEAMRSAPVKFRYGSAKRRILIDSYSASAILLVYDAVNPENKAKIERMIASPAGLIQVQAFAFKSCR